MTQICPGFGVAPVPTLLWLIFRPDGVVVVALAAWAIAAVGAMSAKAPARAVATAAAARALANGKARILLLLLIDCVIVVASSVVGWAKRSVPTADGGHASLRFAHPTAINRRPRQRGGQARRPGGRDTPPCRGCRRQDRPPESSALRAISAETAF